MPDSSNHNPTLLIIADKIKESIAQQRLHSDYSDILAYCRSKKISSFILDLIIRQELKSFKKEAPSQMPLPQMMEIVAPESPVTEGKDTSASTDPEQKENPEIEPEKRKSSGSFRRFALTIWTLSTFALIGMLVGLSIDLKSTEGEITSAKQIIRPVAESLTVIYPSNFGNWDSQISTNNTEETFVFPIYAEAGDNLSGTAWVDCEDRYDYLEVSFGKERQKMAVISRITGADTTSTISKTIPNDGIFYVQAKYKKDSSLSRNSDKGGVRDLHLSGSLKEAIDYLLP